MQFNAGVPLAPEEVDQLLAEGVQVFPTQWVEADRNARKRRGNDFEKVPRLLKSRLVGCGR
eukprot:4320947-Lingulodinium_polyedra.AAC.1